jgi:hypothetical protein
MFPDSCFLKHTFTFGISSFTILYQPKYFLERIKWIHITKTTVENALFNLTVLSIY